MILVLDITLNNFLDFTLRETLNETSPFVQNGQLEIFGVQSLAKLVQLGADNFSGGACFHLSSTTSKSLFFSNVLGNKEYFFNFLLEKFKEIIKNYFQLVRQNADRMYQRLQTRLDKIRAGLFEPTVKPPEEEFCATAITLNTDDSTVYVALSFKPYFDRMNTPDDNKEALVKKFQNILLLLAKMRDIPLTRSPKFRLFTIEHERHSQHHPLLNWRRIDKST